jgi:2'-5' RNA ligase
MTQTPPLILTLQLDGTSARYFNNLRQQYFPPARNFLPAHVTLFHHLPGDEIRTITADLEGIASGHGPIRIGISRVRSLGRGVAYELQSEPLAALRNCLARRWSPWLTPQDRQPFKAHVTVQNKVSPDEARRTLAILTAAFTPHPISGVGLDLWRYLGGPWEHLREFLF